MRAAHGIAGCSVLTAIGGNGSECGIKVSGLGDRWFTATGEVPKGVLQPGFDMADVAPGCGDSFLIECAGLGASVLPAAPAFGPVIGASLEDAHAFAERAYQISVGEHPHYQDSRAWISEALRSASMCARWCRLALCRSLIL